MSLSAIAASAQQDSDFYLKSGDRVAFYGDSITEQMMYSTIVETFVATRYPKLDISFMNLGWGGDTVAGGLGGPIETRLSRDVIADCPTVVTIMLGMNDGRYRPETISNDTLYFRGYEHIIATLSAALPNVRVTLLQPSPYDDVTDQPLQPVPPDVAYNQILIGFGQWLANYGRSHQLTVADLNTGFVSTLKRAAELDPKLAREVIPGRVHPSFAGHLLMACDLLSAWNARAVVSSVSLHATGHRATLVSAAHATVTALAYDRGLSWDELDDALPLPLAGWRLLPEDGRVVGLILQSSNTVRSLNMETLKVEGLQKGVYGLRIDGSDVTAVNSDELEQGIELGALDTPMSRQAMSVYNMTLEKDNLQYDNWRHIQVALQGEKLDHESSAVAAMDALVQDATQRRDQLARPVLHHYQLVPLS